MLTVNEIKDTLRDETLNDAVIEKTIARVYEYLKSYTNNPNLPDSLEIEDIAMYLVIQRLNRDTMMRAGKQSESIGGVNTSYSQDLPLEIKIVLAKHNMVKAFR